MSLLSIHSSTAENLSDNFDSYGQGELIPGQEWSEAIPESDDLFWRAWHYGEQAIIDGSELGRKGNVYRSTLNQGDQNAYSFMRLHIPYSGESWTISFDFCIDALATESSGSTVVLMRIYDTGGNDSNFSYENIIGGIFLQESNGLYTLKASFGNQVGESHSAPLYPENITPKQWYTVSISGNNASQSLNFTLKAEGQDEVIVFDKFYSKNTSQIDGFAIGNMGSRVTGTFYLDNISGIPKSQEITTSARNVSERLVYAHAPGKSAGAARARWRELTQGENLALGKEVFFSKKPNYFLTRSDSDPYDLTDGKLSSQADDRIWFGRDAVGFTTADYADSLSIDLGENFPVDRAAIRLLGGKEQDGLVLPSEIVLVGSEDGENFFVLAELRSVNFSEKELAERHPESFFFIPEEGEAFMYPFVFPVNRTLRHIGFILKSPTGYAFTDQIAVIKGTESAPDLSDLKSIQFINEGIAIRPKHDELVISSNVITPNFFRLADTRPEPDREDVRFIFDLPDGVSLKMGPFGKAHRNPKAPEGKNQWIIEGLYKGIRSSGHSGPFYFEIEKGRKIPENATASFAVDRPDSTRNTIVTPIRSIEIPEVPAIPDFDVSLAWMEEQYQYNWPDFFSSFRHLGFNSICVFPRNQMAPENRKKMVSFTQEARKNGFKIVYNESPFHVMWNLWRNKQPEENPEIRNQIDGQPGRYPCPCYTGEHYQKEIERIAQHAKDVSPDQVFFDIELWSSPAREAEKCSRCQQKFTEWKKQNAGEWADFMMAQGDRMQRDLHAAISGTGPDGQTPISGNYGLNTDQPVSHRVHRLATLHPQLIDFTMPSLYNQGNVREIHRVIRDNTEKLGPRQTIPWLTTGTWGEIPPHRVEQMVLESFLNGARGVTYYKFDDFEPMDFYYQARALKLLAPYQTLLKNGNLVNFSGNNTALVYSAFGSENEALVLIGNYRNHQEALTSLDFGDRQVEQAQDVINNAVITLDKLEIPADGHRLLLVNFQSEK